MLPQGWHQHSDIEHRSLPINAELGICGALPPLPNGVVNKHTPLLLLYSLRSTQQTLWSRVLLGKPIVAQLVKKFFTFYRPRRFIYVCTYTRHQSISWIQSTPTHTISLRYILILSSHLRLGLPNGIFHSGFPTEFCINLLSPPCALHVLSISSSLIWSWNTLNRCSSLKVRVSRPHTEQQVQLRFFFKSWGAGVAQSVWWLTTDWTGFDPRQRQRIVLLASASRPALGPTQPPVQWVPGAFSPGVKRDRGVMLTTHPHLVPRLNMSTSSSPMCLHGV
jgi:hypothetical protein